MFRNRQKSIRILFFPHFFCVLQFPQFSFFFPCSSLPCIFLSLPFATTPFEPTREFSSVQLTFPLSFLAREIENAARKAPGEMAALCVPNLCRAVLYAPLRGTISQGWLSPFTLLPTHYDPFSTDLPLLFSPTRKIIATALRITRSYLRPVRLQRTH